jgi:LysR family hydrogen peroxide-inducible transcriptional activator
MSEQIKELEETFGSALFERGARQVRVTGFGEDLFARVSDILRAIDDLEGLASNNRPLRRLRLGVIPTVAPYLLPAVVRDLNRAYPKLEIHVRETITPKLIDELAQGRIDAAVVALPISEDSFEEFTLFGEEFLLVQPRASAAKPPRNPEQLRDMRLLLLEEGHCFRDQALAVCGLSSLGPREALDASSLSTLVQMVGAGIGVTLIPEMAVAVETRSAPVAVSRFTNQKPSRTIGMVWRKTNPLAGQLRQFAQVVRNGSERRSSRGKLATPERTGSRQTNRRPARRRASDA